MVGPIGTAQLSPNMQMGIASGERVGIGIFLRNPKQYHLFHHFHHLSLNHQHRQQRQHYLKWCQSRNSGSFRCLASVPLLVICAVEGETSVQSVSVWHSTTQQHSSSSRYTQSSSVGSRRRRRRRKEKRKAAKLLTIWPTTSRSQLVSQSVISPLPEAINLWIGRDHCCCLIPVTTITITTFQSFSSQLADISCRVVKHRLSQFQWQTQADYERFSLKWEHLCSALFLALTSLAAHLTFTLKLSLYC